MSQPSHSTSSLLSEIGDFDLTSLDTAESGSPSTSPIAGHALNAFHGYDAGRMQAASMSLADSSRTVPVVAPENVPHTLVSEEVRKRQRTSDVVLAPAPVPAPAPIPASVLGQYNGTQHLPASMWRQRAGNDRTIACPRYLAAIILGRDPGCDGLDARHINEIHIHLRDTHHMFVEACPVCKQVVLSQQDKAAHGQGFKRCINHPFKKRGPIAVQVQFEALFHKLNPFISPIPSAYNEDFNNYLVALSSSQHPSSLSDDHQPADPNAPPHLIQQPFLRQQQQQHSSNELFTLGTRPPNFSRAADLPADPLFTEIHSFTSPEDVYMQNRILRELLVEERLSKLPEGKRENATDLIEAHINQQLQHKLHDSLSLTSSPFTQSPSHTEMALSTRPISTQARVQSVPLAIIPRGSGLSIPQHNDSEHSQIGDDTTIDTFQQEENTTTYEPISTPLFVASSDQPYNPPVLECPEKDCAHKFTGDWRKANLTRHIRAKHEGPVKMWPCEEEGCGREFRRNDARLHHYRKRHPWRTEPVQRRK